MQTPLSNSDRAPRASQQAFSLVELLTAVSIMVLIIFALYSMFNQTQKALRANVTQVDVLESGRAVAEMLGRDLEQMDASGLGQTVNFYVKMIPVAPVTQMDVAENVAQAPLRTNILQEFYFLTRRTNSWVATGYRVLQAANGVGTLYRMSISTNYQLLNTNNNLLNPLTNAVPTFDPTGAVLGTNFNRVADGIIHLRLVAYDPQGRRMGWDTTNVYPSYHVLRLSRSGGKLGLYSTAANLIDSTVRLQQDPMDPRETLYTFTSNALPASIEVELGVMEPFAVKQLAALRDSPPKVAQTFLKKQAARVHLFRQRIPIRTVQQ